MHTRYEPVWVNFHPHDHIVTIYGIVTMYHLPQYRKWVLQEEIWWSPDNTDKDVPDVPLQAEIQSRSVLWCTLQFTIFSLSSSFSWRCVPIIAHSLRSEIAEKIFHSGYSNFLSLSLSLSLFIYICSRLKAQLRFWPGSILRRWRPQLLHKTYCDLLNRWIDCNLFVLTALISQRLRLSQDSSIIVGFARKSAWFIKFQRKWYFYPAKEVYVR